MAILTVGEGSATGLVPDQRRVHFERSGRRRRDQLLQLPAASGKRNRFLRSLPGKVRLAIASNAVLSLSVETVLRGHSPCRESSSAWHQHRRRFGASPSLSRRGLALVSGNAGADDWCGAGRDAGDG